MGKFLPMDNRSCISARLNLTKPKNNVFFEQSLFLTNMNDSLLQSVSNRIREMLDDVGIPGEITAEALRLCPVKMPEGIRLLKKKKQGKVAINVWVDGDRACLCTLRSDRLTPHDLRLVISSSRKLEDDFYTFKKHASLLEELEALKNTFAADKRMFPVPDCVERLRTVRDLMKDLDENVKEIKALYKKAREFRTMAVMASDRADKMTRNALRLTQNIAF
jgi:hypothetical protein